MATATGIRSRRTILASNSSRKRRIAEVMGDTADGPSGQIVSVGFGGQAPGSDATG
jgi:hypothetical protein